MVVESHRNGGNCFIYLDLRLLSQRAKMCHEKADCTLTSHVFLFVIMQYTIHTLRLLF